MGIVQSKKVSPDVDEMRIRKRDGLRGVIAPIHFFLVSSTAGTGANFGTTFFTAHRTYEVVEVFVRYGAAGAAGSTIMLKRVPDGETVANGDDLLAAPISLAGAVTTIHEGTVKSNEPDRRIRRMDGLGLTTSGTISNLEDLSISILLNAL